MRFKNAIGRYNKPGGVAVISSPTLATLTLSGTLTNGSSSSGTILGATTASTIVSNVTGLTVNSALRTYAWDGTGTAGSTSNGLVETLAGAIGSPNNSSITVAAATVTLGTLSLSGTITNGTSSSGTITGASTGSTIVSNVTGLTVNSGARTYSWDGTGAAGSTSNGLVETLSGATGSPKSSSITVASTTGINAPVITQTSTAGAAPFAWSVAEDATFFPGDFWHVMRAAANSFPPISNNIVINGDSWDVDYSGYYAGYWKSLHGELNITNVAVGGRSVGTLGTANENTLTFQESTVNGLRPQIYFAGSGANDLANYASGTLWAADLKAHFQRILDANPGVLLIGRTVLALQLPGSPAGNAIHNANRPAANAALRQWLADGFLTGLVDFAANSSIGDDADMVPAAASSTTISIDGQHLYDRQGVSSGHDIASPIFATEVDRVVALMPVLNGEAVQQITVGDLVDTSTIVFADMPSAPAGSLYLRMRVGQDNGAGGYTWGAWSNVLHDTITASSTAVLVGTNGVNKNQYIDTTGSPKLIATMNNVIGSNCAVRATQTASGKRHWEMTINAFSAGDTPLNMGVGDSATAIGPAVYPMPGNTGVPGFSVSIYSAYPNINTFANGGSPGDYYLIGSVPPQVGDVFAMEFDTATNVVDLWQIRGATVLLLGSRTLTSGIPTNWSAQVGATSNGGTAASMTANFGATTFAKSLTSGYSMYG